MILTHISRLRHYLTLNISGIWLGVKKQLENVCNRFLQGLLCRRWYEKVNLDYILLYLGSDIKYDHNGRRIGTRISLVDDQ